MNNEEIVDGEFEEITEREVRLTSDLSDEELEQLKNASMADEHAHLNAEVEVAQEKNEGRQLTQREMIQAVNAAVSEGVLGKSRKQRMLREMGIYKSEFTKKRNTSKTSKAKKNKAQKKARRKNRK